MEKILNKRKVREVMKYSVHWKRFTVENNTWKKKKNLENMRELVLQLKLLVLDQRKTLYRIYTRELNRELFYRTVYFIYQRPIVHAKPS